MILARRFATATMEKQEEKRSFGRKSICKAVTIEMSVTQYAQLGKLPETGLGVDISHGGIGLITECLLEEGNLLKLYFPVAETKTNLPVYAQVMWAKPANGKFRAGLSFWDKPAWRKSHR